MFSHPLLLRLFPFLTWFPVNSIILRGDVIAGITGALVLVPKAMAYAQLSGLPVHYGLYAALVPAVIAALWGSSRQLATGPVAIISLMTAAAITPFAVPLSEEFVGLALLLALMVGIIQFALGALKLGTIVNFVSHPAILGFMNAAAIIIALSQLNMLLGIPMGRSEFFLRDVWEMLGYLPQAHLPTLVMSLFALLLMLGLKKIGALSKPSVLIAVVITTLASYAIDFERQYQATPEHLHDPAIRQMVSGYMNASTNLHEFSATLARKTAELRQLEKEQDTTSIAHMNYQIELVRMGIANLERENKLRMKALRKLRLVRAEGTASAPSMFYIHGQVPADVTTDKHHWRIHKIGKDSLTLMGGGDVVGHIPAGLPGFKLPTLSIDAVMALFSAALIIALVAFMESISMAKAMAAKTKDKINPNQELIGQGLANIGGSFFQSYPACGSFTGSAINLQAGAKTGFAMVFNAIFIALALLLLTDYLYHLPKAVLAVIILLAVTTLITPKAIRHTWKAGRADGVVALTTFVATLAFAPHLDKGIMVGAVLAIGLHLYSTMKPRVAILGRYPDGTLRDAKLHGLPTSDVVTAVRFDGRLYFANVSYFEEAVISAIADNPKAPYVLIVGDGINDIDASGEEVIHHLVERLNENGIVILFSGLKRQVLDVMQSTGLRDKIGEKRFFSTADEALNAIYARPEYAGDEDPLSPSRPAVR